MICNDVEVLLLTRSNCDFPKEYFKSLMDRNPLLSIPDSAGTFQHVLDAYLVVGCFIHFLTFTLSSSIVFVARTSLLFRGMGNAVGSGQIRTSLRWYKNARKALDEFDRSASVALM